MSRIKRIIKGLKAPFWRYLEKPLNKTAFVIYLVLQIGSTELSSTFDSNRRSFNYLSRPKLSLGSAHVKYGVWPGPKIRRHILGREKKNNSSAKDLLPLLLLLLLLFLRLKDRTTETALGTNGIRLGRAADFSRQTICYSLSSGFTSKTVQLRLFFFFLLSYFFFRLCAPLFFSPRAMLKKENKRCDIITPFWRHSIPESKVWNLWADFFFFSENCLTAKFLNQTRHCGRKKLVVEK